MSHAQIRVPSREQAPANNPLHGHPHNRLVIAAKVLVMPVFSLPGTSSAELDVYPVKIESDSSSLASVGRRLSGKIIGKNCEKLVSRLKHHLLFQSIDHRLFCGRRILGEKKKEKYTFNRRRRNRITWKILIFLEILILK